MAWFQKRDPQILDAIERDINQFYAYVQNGYALKALAERGAFKGRGINVSVDLSTSAVTARFSADDFANLCHGRSHTIDAQNDAPHCSSRSLKRVHPLHLLLMPCKTLPPAP